MTAPTKWPPYYVGPESHIHAIGIVAMLYTSLEVVFESIIHHYMNTNEEIQAFVFSSLRQQSQAELLRICLACKETNQDRITHVEHFIDCFNACSANRNTLMHADINATDSTGILIALEKRSKRKPHVVNMLKLKASDIQRVADEMNDVWIFGARLYLILAGDHANQHNPYRHISSWPDKPQIPASLYQEDRATQPKPQRPRRSSPE